MIEKVIRYRTEDGIDFKGEGEAKEHDRFISEVAELSEMIKPRPDWTNKAVKGIAYYIQQESTTVYFVRARLLALLSKKYPNRHQIESALINKNAHPSHVERLLMDFAPFADTALRLFLRIAYNTDKYGREFQFTVHVKDKWKCTPTEWPEK